MKAWEGYSACPIGYVHDRSGIPFGADGAGTGLVEFYCHLEGLSLEAGVEQLCEMLEIDDTSPATPPHIPASSPWRQLPTNPNAAPRLRFPEALESKHYDALDRYGRRLFSVVVHYLDDGTKVVLPSTSWNRRGEECVHTLHVPPPTQDLIRFPQEPAMDSPRGRSHWGAGKIVVTVDSPEVGEALSRVCPGQDFASWYGEEAGIDHVDRRALAGKWVVHVMCNHSGLPRERVVGIGREAARKFGEQAAEVSVVDLFSDICPGGSTPRWAWGASKHGLIDLSGTVRRDEPRHGAVGMQREGTRTHEGTAEGMGTTFLLDPVIPVNGLTVLVGKPGRGKSRLALHLAFSVACGADVLGRWRNVVGPQGVLYVCGSADAPHTSMRLAETASAFDREQRERIAENLFAQGLYGQLDDESAQEDVEILLARARAQLGALPKLLVLDGFVPFQDLQHDARRWHHRSRWLADLEQRGVAVLAVAPVHDAERLEATATSVIEVAACGDAGGSRTALHIRIVKGRQVTARSSQVVVELVEGNTGVSWRVRRNQLKDSVEAEDGMVALVRELMEKGCSNNRIADELCMNINTFKAMKRKLGLTRAYRTGGGGGKGASAKGTGRESDS
jgi:hypothetical protein